jgi:MEMO1 family protein
VEVIRVRAEGEDLFCLRDRLDPTSAPLVISQPALLLVSIFDGSRTLEAVRSAFLLQTGHELPRSDIRGFVARLDDAGFIDSASYRQRLERQQQAFRDALYRPAIHAGSAYPATSTELVDFLERLAAAPDGPGSRPAPASDLTARALIAPHIDLYRGGTTYAWTYAALAERQPADLYVLLGTCHTPMHSPLAATGKAYDTPLGPATPDHRFLRLLESCYPGDLYQDEYQHRGEHSLEFQAVYLRYLGLTGETNGAGVVPLLCGSLHEWCSTGDSPLRRPEVAQVVAALREAIASYPGRVCLLAGADLAHVGPQFGDRVMVTSAVREAVETADRAMLELICRGDAEGFYEQVMSDGDARRICGLSPIYYLLELLGPADGHLIRYDQWVDAEGQGAVTFAGVIFS